MAEAIRISDHPVGFPRATSTPEFGAKRVIASSPWEFVALWLKKNGKPEAAAYWDQAYQFFLAAKGLSTLAAPLPHYYCALNAAKALLESQSISYLPYHGVSGFDLRQSPNARIRLETEGIKIKSGGVAPAVSAYCGDTDARLRYCLADVFSNLPYIHRAYTMSYGKSELYLPISDPRYIKAEAGRARFQARFPKEHTHGQTLRTIPAAFRVRKLSDEEEGFEGHVLETVDTFAWSGARRPTTADIAALKAFHKSLRQKIRYISGARPVWYLQRALSSYVLISRHNLTLTFAAMHRMSEISRYKPIELQRLLGGNRNWVIHEFSQVACNQLIDEMASEITGMEISPAGVRQSTF